MLIKEVCLVCDLTKKAVEYYEQQGFIKPQVLDNGYRDYTDREITKLKEIMRNCGVGFPMFSNSLRRWWSYNGGG